MQEDCTIYKTVDFIGKKWTLLILLELYRGGFKKKRYSQIKKNLPNITPKILSARLKELEKEELVKKKIDSSIFPIKCEYALTGSGREFIDIIKEIKQWSLKWKIENEVCKDSDCEKCTL